MAMDASIGVTSHTKTRFDEFHDDVIPEKRQTDALAELLDIAAEEGYWDEGGEGRGPSYASRSELVARLEDIEAQMDEIGDRQDAQAVALEQLREQTDG